MANGEFLEPPLWPEVKMVSFAQREIRRVPLGFEHPKNEYGHYIGLIGPGQGQYEPEEIQEMLEDGTIQSPEDMKSWYMPDFSDVPEDEMGICAYETCTEGTPISPVFPDTPQGRLALLHHVTENETTFADHKTSIEGWAAILFSTDNISTIVDIQTGDLSVSSRRPPSEQD